MKPVIYKIDSSILKTKLKTINQKINIEDFNSYIKSESKKYEYEYSFSKISNYESNILIKKSKKLSWIKDFPFGKKIPNNFMSTKQVYLIKTFISNLKTPELYVFSSGNGWTIFKSIIKDDFGKSFIEKLLSEDSKSISQDRDIIIGRNNNNVKSVKKDYYNLQPTKQNSNKNSIKKGLELSVNINEIKSILPKRIIEKKKKRIFIKAKDALTINIDLKPDELNTLFEKIAIIDEKPKQFNFDKHCYVNKKNSGYVNRELTKLFIEFILEEILDIKNNKKHNIRECFTEQDPNIFNINKFEKIIMNIEGQPIMLVELKSIEEILTEIFIRHKIKLTKKNIKKILFENEIEIINNEMDMIDKKTVTGLIGIANINYYHSDREYFLENGKKWFFIDPETAKQKREIMQKIYNDEWHDWQANNFNHRIINQKIKNEKEYNDIMKLNPKILYSDSNLIDQVEIADYIFICELDYKIYFYHNKKCFNNKYSTELFKQISSSKTILMGKIQKDLNGTKLKKYFDNLKKHNGKKLIYSNLDFDSFLTKIRDYEKVYVANFIEPIKWNSKSMNIYLEMDKIYSNFKDENNYSLVITDIGQ